MGRLKNRYHEELMKHEPMTSTTDVMEEEHIAITGMTSKELQEAAHTNAEDWQIPMSYSQATYLLSKSILYNEKVSSTQLKIAWKKIMEKLDNAEM